MNVQCTYSQGKLKNSTPNIFNKTLYHSWYREFRNHFSPLLLNTAPKNVHTRNQINGEIPRSGLIDTETINPHDLYYQCSKHGPDFLFRKMRIEDFNDELHFPG